MLDGFDKMDLSFLDESEQRCLVKTTQRWNEAAAAGRGTAYFEGITARQREVLAKFLAEAKRLGLPSPRQLEAFAALGF